MELVVDQAEQQPAIHLFQNFIVDILCKCSDIEGKYVWSIMNELKRSAGFSAAHSINDGRRELDYDPPVDWNIPQFRAKLMTVCDACERYIMDDTNPRNLRTLVYKQHSRELERFKRQYLEKTIETIDAVYPSMKIATKDVNEALINIARLHPMIFWTCFWKSLTGLTSLIQYEEDENDNIRLLHFIEKPIQNHILNADSNQWESCKRALQDIIDRREKHSLAKRILNMTGPSFSEALRITGITLFPHESCLSQDTIQGLNGQLSRRSAAARQRNDTVFFKC